MAVEPSKGSKTSAPSGNLLFVGVGGQGVLLASEIAAKVALACGFDAKKSELHGMAKRGGIVYSHVRFGSKIYSPLIEPGSADILAAFEEAEALRWQHYLRQEGVAIINKKRIPPLSSFFSGGGYPDDAPSAVAAMGRKTFTVDAEAIGSRLGNIKVANSALLGAMSNFLEFPQEVWIEAISEMVPPGTVDLNVKAFIEGRRSVEVA